MDRCGAAGAVLPLQGALGSCRGPGLEAFCRLHGIA